MKEMNLLEMQLRSWELRPPSAALKRHIFQTRTRCPGVVVALRWLAPAAACALLAITVVRQESGIATSPSRHQPMVAMIQSNQSLAADLSNGPTRAGNDFSAVGFEWTNRSDCTSNTRSLSPAR